MRPRFLCGVVFVVVGLAGYAGMTSDLRGGQPVPDSEAARLMGGSEYIEWSIGGGCLGTCNPTTNTKCSSTNTYRYEPSSSYPGFVNNQAACGTCGAGNHCSVVYTGYLDE